MPTEIYTPEEACRLIYKETYSSHPDSCYTAHYLRFIPQDHPLRAQAEYLDKQAMIREKCWGDAYL